MIVSFKFKKMKILKLILFIISILIFSSPVIGKKNKEVTLYLLGEFPDWEWIVSGDKNTQPKYHGQVKDGKPNGLGVLISTNGWRYFGNWKNGKIWSGTEYDNYGNIIFRWVEGKKNYHKLYKF